MDNPASEAARLMGSIRTPKKAAASRENGKLGGAHAMTDELRQKISEGQKRRWQERRDEAAKDNPK
jgi:hypothetical protein